MFKGPSKNDNDFRTADVENIKPEQDDSAIVSKDESTKRYIGLSSMRDHCLSFEQLEAKFNIKLDVKRPMSSKGLNNQQAAERLQMFGENTVTIKSKSSLHIKFIESLTNLFNVLLYAAGTMYLICYAMDPIENFESVWIGPTLISVGVVNGAIGFYEEYKISAILNSFKGLIERQSVVIRGDRRVIIPSTQLVPGDIIYLDAGANVPADSVLFFTNDLRIDGSNLTGESDPFIRSALPQGCAPNTDPFECPNVVFSSDVVVSGEGFAVVLETGQSSIAGKIRKLTGEIKIGTSQLNKEIVKFSKTIGSIAFITSLVFFIYGLIRGRGFVYAATFGIGSLIAWIPQGLPLTVTMILAIAGRRMADQNVLLKDLHGIETLGAITLLATDKTGTLTRNQMTVTDLWLNTTFLHTGNKPTIPKSQPIKMDISGVAQLMHVCITCSKAKMEKLNPETNTRQIIGDSTETGLIRFASERLKNVDQVESMYPKVFEVPFSSETKTHLTIHRKSHSTGGLTLHIKGAPERVWSLCSSIWVSGKIIPLDPQLNEKYQAALLEITKKGSRTLAVAILQLSGREYPDNFKFDFETGNYPKSGFTFLGLIGLEDPPKVGVDNAISTIKGAGIKVLMVTGDNAVTAETISRQVNLLQSSNVRYVQNTSDLPIKSPEPGAGVVITGNVIDYFGEEDWLNSLCYDEIIFARTLPNHKVEIVKHAQALGHIVAVTGDGVNDSAALKQADLGISMNKTGSDVTKECARMILLDDDFSTTVNGIREGRLIFQNLKKAIKYSLSHIVSEILPYLLYVIVPIPLPITPTQTLAVDLGFELLFTLSFAWEPVEDDQILMSLPPRRLVTNEVCKQRHKEAMEQQNILRRQVDVIFTAPNMTDVDESTELLNVQETNGENQIQQDLLKLNAKLQTRYKTYIKEATQIADKQYWKAQIQELKELTAVPTGERLIDAEVLCWSYLEAGMIEFLGALTTYYIIFYYSFNVSIADAKHSQNVANTQWKPHSPDLTLYDGTILTGDRQFEAIKQVQSGFYLSIFIIQIFNYFACKKRYTIAVRMRTLQNRIMWMILMFGGMMTTLVVYTPLGNAIFITSSNLPLVYLLVPTAFGGFLYFYATIRRLILQHGINLNV
ncbi:hypothetical protein BC833DRAFT_614428 [Globomyces pollinis-pini]|nr:hypothetical protein BC833DRAFT_614428 [Globomyces pollinis-pini]